MHDRKLEDPIGEIFTKPEGGIYQEEGEIHIAAGENIKWNRLYSSVNPPARMNQADLFVFHEKFCTDALAVTKKKNNDYAGSGGTHPFANFELAEEMGICTTEQGFLVRLSDKRSPRETTKARSLSGAASTR